MTTLWKTYSAATPIYSDQASADADVIAIANSVIPAPTSDFTLQGGGDTSRYPSLRVTSPGLALQCIDFAGAGSNEYWQFANRSGTSLAVSNVISSTAMTIFVSFRIETMPGAGSYGPLMFDSSGNYWGMRIDGTSGKLGFYNHDGGYQGHLGDAVAINTNYVACMQHDTTTIYGSINNGSVSTSSCGTQSNMTSGFYVGGDTGPGYFFNGRIGEILFYNAVLSGSDRTDAYNYMIDKWN